jgi:hypothetical protein
MTTLKDEVALQYQRINAPCATIDTKKAAVN